MSAAPESDSQQMTYGCSRRAKQEAANWLQQKLWKIVESRASCSHRLRIP
jgi:hypothetical protein